MHDKQKFDEELNNILEEVDAMPTDSFTDAASAFEQLSRAEELSKNASKSLRSAVSVLNAKLAGEIRRHQPALETRISRDGTLIISYFRSKNKSMTLAPDLENRRWKMGNTPFEENYKRYFGSLLGADLEALGESIARYFSRYFKSIREDMYGVGKMIVEEILDVDTVSGSGVLSRLNSSYGELKAAYEFAQRAELSPEIIDEIDTIGRSLIELAQKLEATGHDTENA